MFLIKDIDETLVKRLRECGESLMEELVIELLKVSRWPLIFKVGGIYVNVENKCGNNVQQKEKGATNDSQNERKVGKECYK